MRGFDGAIRYFERAAACSDCAKEWAERGALLDPDNMNMRYNVACALITDLGDHDGGLDILGPYVERVGPEGLHWIKADPDMDAVRGDPRFQGMIRQADARLGIPNS